MLLAKGIPLIAVNQDWVLLAGLENLLVRYARICVEEAANKIFVWTGRQSNASSCGYRHVLEEADEASVRLIIGHAN